MTVKPAETTKGIDEDPVMKKPTRFASVWDGIEDTPQQAASMRARSELMMACRAG